MNLLVDTDVLIDVALDRRPHATAAGELLDSLQRREGSGFVAWHSISNFHYLVSPVRGGGPAKEFLRNLCGFLEIAPTTTEHFELASELLLRDFEDALQVGAAIAARAERIVTRNLRDFAKSPIPACSPKDALRALRGVR